MEKIKLKPCPFCGGEAEILSVRDINMLCKDYDNYYTIRCRCCFNGTGYYADRERAAEAWNRRGGEQNE